MDGGIWGIMIGCMEILALKNVMLFLMYLVSMTDILHGLVIHYVLMAILFIYTYLIFYPCT